MITDKEQDYINGKFDVLLKIPRDREDWKDTRSLRGNVWDIIKEVNGGRRRDSYSELIHLMGSMCNWFDKMCDKHDYDPN